MYQWRYPAKLIISKDNIIHTITTVEDGLCLARKWSPLTPSEGFQKAATYSQAGKQWDDAYVGILSCIC